MGYDIELFLQQPVNENLVCHICYNVLEKPLSVCKEGHSFCHDCVNSWEARSSSCPSCRSSMTDDKLLNLPIKNITMSLPVRCCQVTSPSNTAASLENADEDTSTDSSSLLMQTRCSWQGTLAEYLEQHHCKYVECDLGCGQEIRICFLETHKQTECPRRMVVCPHCNSSMMHFQRLRHKCHSPLVVKNFSDFHQYNVTWMFPMSILQQHAASRQRKQVSFESECISINHDDQQAFLWLVVKKDGTLHARLCISTSNQVPFISRLLFYNEHARYSFQHSMKMRKYPSKQGVYWAGGPLCFSENRRRRRRRHVTLQDLLEWYSSRGTNFVLQGSFSLESMEFEA